MADLKERVLSGVILLAITIPCILLWEISRILLFAAAGMVSVREFCQSVEKERGIHCASLVLYAYIIAEACMCLLHKDLSAHLICLVFCVYAAMFSGITCDDISIFASGAACTVAGLAYPFLLFGAVMLVASSGIWLETLSIACLSTWICDSFALFGGRRFGRHKIAPAVSPNKTVEGCLCGAASALVTGSLLPFLPFLSGIRLEVCVLTALLASSAGQVGDLAESLVKRMLGIKDFSNLVPGHGGMLDRADSLLFSIPIAWFCLHLAGV